MPLIESVNPATGKVLATFEPFDQRAVDAALDRAQRAFARWSSLPVDARADGLRGLAAILRERRESYAELITSEMGKPITEALAEIEKCAWTCEYVADNGAAWLADEQVTTTARESYIAFEPLGVILAVMPWNFPFWQVIRFLAPALLAGNVAVLKHASNVTMCALAVEQAVTDAGLPAGALTTVLLPGSQVEPLLADPRIRALTLTGSTDTGRRLAALAGHYVKKSVLELGGSDPFIVLRDADLPAAAAMAARARFLNSGQTCIAAKRILVDAAVAAEFEGLLAAEVRALRVGDPMDADTTIGPLARPDLRDALADQVARSVAQGARVVEGGEPIVGDGSFYPPTLLAGVDASMPVACEETFGPVAVLIEVDGPDDAIRIANDSPYGLSAAIWTRDIDAARSMARHLETGGVFVNGMTVSDPRLPFGGTKQSGYGRELSAFGIREFVNVQTVWVGPAEAVVPLGAAATASAAQPVS